MSDWGGYNPHDPESTKKSRKEDAERRKAQAGTPYSDRNPPRDRGGNNGSKGGWGLGGK